MTEGVEAALQDCGVRPRSSLRSHAQAAPPTRTTQQDPLVPRMCTSDVQISFFCKASKQSFKSI